MCERNSLKKVPIGICMLRGGPLCSATELSKLPLASRQGAERLTVQYRYMYMAGGAESVSLTHRFIKFNYMFLLHFT